jgi:hypothetical protein
MLTRLALALFLVRALPLCACGCPADDFTAYETNTTPVVGAPVEANTAIGSGMVDVERLHRVLTPVDLNGMNPAAPTDNTHFAAFETSTAGFPKLALSRTFVTDLGMVTFKAAQIRFLIDPCTKVVGPTPGPPPSSGLAFLCFAAGSGSSGPKLTADCDDQFGDFQAQLLRVAYACVAVGLGATPAPPEQWLVCLGERGAHRPPNVSLDTLDFGAFPDVNLASPDEICLNVSSFH